MNSAQRIHLLFVCMGNICRSPTAQGVAESQLARLGLQDRVTVDSAGTHAYHVGEPPDRRACRAAAQRGMDLTQQRARRVSHNDFEAFDYILAMDQHNFLALQEIAPEHRQSRVFKIMQFSRLDVTDDVPDPYYGGNHGFEQVLELLEDAVDGLIEYIKERHPELGAK